MLKRLPLALAFFCLFSFYLLLTTPVHAQLEINDVYDLSDKDAVDGDILSYTAQGIQRSKAEYDTHIFGVLQKEPLATLKRGDNTGDSIARSGTVLVNVTTINGPIKKGDYVTSSMLPGKAEKGIISGVVLGVALADVTDGDGTKVSYTPTGGQAKQVSLVKIPVAVKSEYAELSTARNANRLLDAVNAAFFSNVQNPEKFVNIIRYILAGLAVIVSFAVGFFTLARSIPKSIEALGRNPLARSSIQLGIIINIVFTVIIAGIGLIAAVVLLRF